MSTKIYNAYKIKNSDLVWETLHDIRIKAEKQIKKKLENFYVSMMEDIDTYSEEYKIYLSDCFPNQSDLTNRFSFINRKIHKSYKEASTSPYKSTYNFDVSIILHKHKTGFYIRAFCDYTSAIAGSLDFLQHHKNLTDFHYQNQTDKPETISSKEWKEREKIWDDIFGNWIDRDALVLHICEYNTFYLMDNYTDLLRKFTKKQLKFPTIEENLAFRLRKIKELSDITASVGKIESKSASISIDMVDARETINWTVKFSKGQIETFKTIYQAYDRVWFEFQPKEYKNMFNKITDGTIDDKS